MIDITGTCSECGRCPRQGVGGGVGYPGLIKWRGHARTCSRRWLAPDTLVGTITLKPQPPFTEPMDDEPESKHSSEGTHA